MRDELAKEARGVDAPTEEAVPVEGAAPAGEVEAAPAKPTEVKTEKSAAEEEMDKTESDGPKEPLRNTTTMLADACTLLTGVDTVSVDTSATFKIQGFNLDSIMQDAEVMEFDLLNSTPGQPTYHHQKMQVASTVENIQEPQKAFEIPASKLKLKATKKPPDERLPTKNKDKSLRCREYRKNKNAKLGKEQVVLERLEVRNQELKQEEEEIDGTALREDVTTDVAAGHDPEEIHEMAKGIAEAGLEVPGIAKKIFEAGLKETNAIPDERFRDLVAQDDTAQKAPPLGRLRTVLLMSW